MNATIRTNVKSSVHIGSQNYNFRISCDFHWEMNKGWVIDIPLWNTFETKGVVPERIARAMRDYINTKEFESSVAEQVEEDAMKEAYGF